MEFQMTLKNLNFQPSNSFHRKLKWVSRKLLPFFITNEDDFIFGKQREGRGKSASYL
jgi:hypothetical protein